MSSIFRNTASIFPAYFKLILITCATALSGFSAFAQAVDPNCNIVVAMGAPINNPGVANPQNNQDAANAIAQLAFADLYRQPPFRISSGTVRLDVQGINSRGDANWQIQINNQQGHSTISHAQVSGALAAASTGDRQAYVQRKVRHALNESLRTHNSFSVTGTCH